MGRLFWALLELRPSDLRHFNAIWLRLDGVS